MNTCSGNTYTYAANGGADLSYLWTISSGSGSISGSYSNIDVQVNWFAAGTGSLQLIETDNSNGTKDTVSQNISISNQPTASITGQNAACSGDSLQYSTPPSGVTNYWEVSGGKLYGKASNPSIWVVWNTAGQGKVTLTQTNAGACADSTTIQVTVNQTPSAEIIGNLPVQKGSTQIYSSNNSSGLIF